MNHETNARQPAADPGLPQFEFVEGPGAHALRITFRGFWDEETAERYTQALRRRAIDAGGRTATTRVLIDLRRCLIQSQAVMDRMERIIASYADQIDHYGMLLPQTASLLTLQMKRLMEGSDIRYFVSDHEAAEWLAGTG